MEGLSLAGRKKGSSGENAIAVTPWISAFLLPVDMKALSVHLSESQPYLWWAPRWAPEVGQTPDPRGSQMARDPLEPPLHPGSYPKVHASTSDRVPETSWAVCGEVAATTKAEPPTLKFSAPSL